MFTRMDDVSVVKSEPITVPSTGRNLKVRAVKEGGRNVKEVRIEPVSNCTFEVELGPLLCDYHLPVFIGFCRTNLLAFFTGLR